MTEKKLNIAQYLPKVASRLGDKKAVSVPVGQGSDGKTVYRDYTFRQVNDESDRYAHGLVELGIANGARALLMVKPGFEFIALTFALFKTGAVPVLIDPGMGKSNLLNCVAQSKPEALVAIPLAHLARLIYPGSFRSITKYVTVGRRWLWGGKTHHQLKTVSDKPFPMARTDASDSAAILFTTGSTGIPKGVVYTHAVFDAQVNAIRDRYDITEDDVDLPAFPLFALFSITMGMRVVIPDMDATRPASVDPKIFADAINDQGVTFTFGSPAIWKKVSYWCVENEVTTPSLTRVLMAGAPVANEIHKNLLTKILPEGAKTHTPFGATESLPVCDFTGAEVLAETAERTAAGAGFCVGSPLPGMSVEIIAITDDPIEKWSESLNIPQGEIGEIVVKGPVVTSEYFELPEQTRLAKIYDEGVVRHRMGDVGYLDDKGRLWFCGRKSHRVVTKEATLFTIPCEAIFNAHPDVARTALVGTGDVGDQTPVIIAELKPISRGKDKGKIAEELLALGAESSLTTSIKRVLFHDEFPTDIRHNAKIFREKLKIWAEGEKQNAFMKKGDDL